MRRLAITLALALVPAIAGCKGKSKSEGGAFGGGSGRPVPIAAPERQRGSDACEDYLARVCACAKTKPDLLTTCENRSLPDALHMALAVDDDPAATRLNVLQAQAEARKIIARCIEESTKLPSMGCPP